MRMIAKLTMALTTASVLLAGCASTTEPKPEPKPQANAPIDTICVVRHTNPVLSGDQLVGAIEAGLQRVGVKTRVVPADTIPSECRLCLYYGVTTEGETAKTFDFQAVIDGRALQRGSGPVEATGNIELRTIAIYAANYIQSLANSGKQKRAAEDAVSSPEPIVTEGTATGSRETVR